MFSSSKIVEVI